MHELVAPFRVDVAKSQTILFRCNERSIWKRDGYPITKLKQCVYIKESDAIVWPTGSHATASRMIIILCWGESVQYTVLAYGCKWLMSKNMTAKTITTMVITKKMTMNTMLWKIMIMFPNELCFTYLIYIHTYRCGLTNEKIVVNWYFLSAGVVLNFYLCEGLYLASVCMTCLGFQNSASHTHKHYLVIFIQPLTCRNYQRKYQSIRAFPSFHDSNMTQAAEICPW